MKNLLWAKRDEKEYLGIFLSANEDTDNLFSLSNVPEKRCLPITKSHLWQETSVNGSFKAKFNILHYISFISWGENGKTPSGNSSFTF